jgi:hypothetical protein
MVCAVLGLYTPSWCWYRCPETGTSSIDWAQQNRFHLKTETESSLRNVVFLNKNRTMDNIQKNNICMNTLFLHTQINEYFHFKYCLF